MEFSSLDFDIKLMIFKQFSLRDLVNLDITSKKTEKKFKEVTSCLVFDKIIYKNIDQLKFFFKYKIKINNLHLDYDLAEYYHIFGVLTIEVYDFWISLFKIIDGLQTENFIFNIKNGKELKEFNIKTIKSRIQKLSKMEIFLRIRDKSELFKFSGPQNASLLFENYDPKNYLKISNLSFNKVIIDSCHLSIDDDVYYDYVFDFRRELTKEMLVFFNDPKVKIRSLVISDLAINLIKEDKLYNILKNIYLEKYILSDISLNKENIEMCFNSQIDTLSFINALLYDYSIKTIYEKSPNIECLSFSYDIKMNLGFLKDLKLFDKLHTLNLFIRVYDFFDDLIVLFEHLGKGKLKRIIVYVENFRRLSNNPIDAFRLRSPPRTSREMTQYSILKNYVEDVCFVFRSNRISVMKLGDH